MPPRRDFTVFSERILAHRCYLRYIFHTILSGRAISRTAPKLSCFPRCMCVSWITRTCFVGCTEVVCVIASQAKCRTGWTEQRQSALESSRGVQPSFRGGTIRRAACSGEHQLDRETRRCVRDFFRTHNKQRRKDTGCKVFLHSFLTVSQHSRVLMVNAACCINYFSRVKILCNVNHAVHS